MTKAKELTEKLSQMNEMGQVGKFSNIKVIVNSTDHPPAQVHLMKDNTLVAKVTIPDVLPDNISQLDSGLRILGMI